MSEETTSAADAAPDATPDPGLKTRRRWPWIALGLAFAGTIGAAAFWGGWLARPLPPREFAEASPRPVDLRHPDLRRPDALIESRSLSRLPRDLLQVPLLRDTLTEEFVFYYEGNADRLGLAGSLRRIVYEHDLEWRDTLLDELLDQPAEVALWRGPDGKLKHFLLLIERGGLARLLEPLAHVALDDSQLSRVGELRVDGSAVGLYRLRYNADRALLFASYGDKLVVLSSPALLFADGNDENEGEQGDGEGQDTALPAREPTEAVEALLRGERPFAKRFGQEPRAAQAHRLTLGADFLALGYQRFIPTFAGLGFEMDDRGWHAALALNEVEDAQELDFASVWRAMPMGASACIALPVAPETYRRLLGRIGAEPPMAEAISASLSDTAGLCWYAESRLHSPLLAATLTEPATAEMDAELGRLFETVIGAREPKAAGGLFPVERRAEGEGYTWQREVSSSYGPYPAAEAAQPDAVAARGFFRVGMARQGSTLLFSLDDRLLAKGRETLARRFPPMADVLPADALVPAFLAPDGLAALFERETLESLPEALEPVFRNAAQTHLLPKLRALATHKRYALALPAGSEPDEPWQWLPLEWRGL